MWRKYIIWYCKSSTFYIWYGKSSTLDMIYFDARFAHSKTFCRSTLIKRHRFFSRLFLFNKLQFIKTIYKGKAWKRCPLFGVSWVLLGWHATELTNRKGIRGKVIISLQKKKPLYWLFLVKLDYYILYFLWPRNDRCHFQYRIIFWDKMPVVMSSMIIKRKEDTWNKKCKFHVAYLEVIG